MAGGNLGSSSRNAKLKRFKHASKIREMNRAHRAYMHLEKRIAKTRATTLEGMRAKVKCAQVYAEREADFGFDTGGCPDVMAQSIFLDVVRNSKAAA
jgi:hypothetical protein